jgi:hypothetical protein
MGALKEIDAAYERDKARPADLFNLMSHLSNNKQEGRIEIFFFTIFSLRYLLRNTYVWVYIVVVDLG